MAFALHSLAEITALAIVSIARPETATAANPGFVSPTAACIHARCSIGILASTAIFAV